MPALHPYGIGWNWLIIDTGWIRLDLDSIQMENEKVWASWSHIKPLSAPPIFNIFKISAFCLRCLQVWRLNASDVIRYQLDLKFPRLLVLLRMDWVYTHTHTNQDECSGLTIIYKMYQLSDLVKCPLKVSNTWWKIDPKPHNIVANLVCMKLALDFILSV